MTSTGLTSGTRRPVILAAIFGVLLWMVAFACYIAPAVLSGTATGVDAVFLALCSLVGFGLSMGVFQVLYGVRRLPMVKAAGIGFAAVLGALVVHAAIDTVSFELIVRARIVLGPEAHVSGQALLFLNNMLLLAPVHITFAISILLGFSLLAIGQRERRLSDALAAAQEAQLAALRLQLNPHFLFNSLNALLSLVSSGRNRDAEEVVARLAAFFRSSLETEPTAVVTLTEEFDMLASYLDIETVRLGERLNVHIDVPRDLGQALVPHFLLQPLAENAVKHGVAPATRTVTVTIRARREGLSLVLEVRDDGAGDGRREGMGVGLRNVEARLNALYGDLAALKTCRDAIGYSAKVRLPLTLQERLNAA